MFVEENKILDWNSPWPLWGNKEQTLYFDIETTGLSPKSSHLYLIGCGYFKEQNWYIRQWFAENSSEEFLILEQFLLFAKDYKTIITYNGTTFDLPYIQEKANAYLLDELHRNNATFINNIDLLRKIKPYKNLLGLSSLHQTDMERYLGLYREDTFTGKELIEVYKEYAKHPTPLQLHQLLLHNREDMSGMMTCTEILSYVSLFQGNYQYEKGELQHSRCQLIFKLVYPVQREFTYTCDAISLEAIQDTLIVSLQTEENKCKLYFPDYEKYVILPDAHTLLPKKLAKSTGMKDLQPATLESCYQYLPINNALLGNEKKIRTLVNNNFQWMLRSLRIS